MNSKSGGVVFEGVTKRYGEVTAVDDVQDLRRSEVVVAKRAHRPYQRPPGRPKGAVRPLGGQRTK